MGFKENLDLINFIAVTKDFLFSKLQQKKKENSFRSLRVVKECVDFCSNDYLGIATNNLLIAPGSLKPGSGGSRLLSGNYELIAETETMIARFHEAEAGLIFNSGYDANIGLISAVARKGDIIIYDQLSHASLRDGARLSFAESFSFNHNDLEDLEKKVKAIIKGCKNIFIITESIFSMDGDMAPLFEISELCQKYHINQLLMRRMQQG